MTQLKTAHLKLIQGGGGEETRGAGDLDRLFREHHRRVLRAAYRVTGNLVDAEDVLQTVFLRLARRGDCNLEPNPGSYLHRSAINAALDLLRQRGRGPIQVSGQRDGQAGGDFVGEVTEPAAGAGYDPQWISEQRETREAVRRAISGLGARMAEMFVLRYFEGYTNREIAGMMGTSAMVVGVMLHRARGRVRGELMAYREGQVS